MRLATASLSTVVPCQLDASFKTDQQESCLDNLPTALTLLMVLIFPLYGCCMLLYQRMHLDCQRQLNLSTKDYLAWSSQRRGPRHCILGFPGAHATMALMVTGTSSCCFFWSTTLLPSLSCCYLACCFSTPGLAVGCPGHSVQTVAKAFKQYAWPGCHVAVLLSPRSLVSCSQKQNLSASDWFLCIVACCLTKTATNKRLIGYVQDCWPFPICHVLFSNADP